MAERVDTRPRVVLALLAGMTLGVTFGLTGCSEPLPAVSTVSPLNEGDLNPPTEAELGREALDLFTKPSRFSRQLVIERARFWQEVSGGNGDFKINRGYLVAGNGRLFSLGTPDGLTIANVLVEASLMNRFPDAAPWWKALPDTALDDIWWMSKRVTISPLSTNFISPHDLVDLARGMRILESAGQEIPISVAINPTKRLPAKTLNFTGEPYRDLAVFVLEKNPNLLEDYKKAVDEALANISQPSLRLEFLSVSKYGYLTYQDSPKQELLTTLAYFLRNAEDIKRRIEVAKKAGFTDEAGILEVKLKILKQWLERPVKDTASLGMSLLQTSNEAFHPGCPECRLLFPQ